jgi:hypothetical protein
MLTVSYRIQGIVKDLAAMALIAVVVCYSFLPSSYFLELDDYFFLAERAYFSNNNQWLWHLLTFSQSRFTWVGDYMLFRPGLFFVNWLFDVCARHDRAILYGISMANYAVAGIILYLACSRYVNRALALALCGLFIVPRYTDTLATWPHINPYLFSMIFLIAGALIFSKKANFQKVNLKIILLTLLFFLASLFHEFMVLTLVFSVVLLLLIYRTKTVSSDEDARGSIRYCSIVFVLSLALFFILFLVNWIKSKVPCFYTPGEGVSFAALSTYLFRYLLLIYKSINFVLPDAILKRPDIYNGVVWLPIIGLFMVVAFRTKSLFIFLKKDRSIDVTAILSLSAIVALAFGIVIGRFITRGSAMAWYIAMIGYFELVITAVLWSRVSDKIPRLATRISQTLFVILAIATIAHRSVVYHNNHREMNNAIQPEISVSRSIIDFLDRHRTYCYAGIFPDPARKKAFDKPDITNIYRSINLVLYYYSSAAHAGIPVYARINGDLEARSEKTAINIYQMNGGDPRPETSYTLLNLQPQKNVPGLNTIIQPRSYNTYESKNKLALADKFTPVYLSDQKYRFQELRVRIKSDDRFPIMYNTGIFYRSDTNITLVALMDNDVVIYSGLGGNRHIVSQGTLPRSSRLFNIIFRRNGSDCLVFMDEYLIAIIPQCDGSPGQIGTGTWENGTLPETVVEASLLPLPDGDATELPMQLVEKIRVEDHL